MIVDGERQVAPTLSGIRRDHVARYEWAASVLPARSVVVDFACGVGYGTQLLADAGHTATGYDKSSEAVGYARKFYPRATYHRADGICPAGAFDAAVCFETIEHVDDPVALLRSLRPAKLLLASVPNESVLPYGAGFAFHHRHYTKDEFLELLHAAGWIVREWYGQAGDESEVERGIEGRTIIALCDRDDTVNGRPVKFEEAKTRVAKAAPVQVVEQSGFAPMEAFPNPEHVAILGLGPSLEQYVDLVKRLGGKHVYCDEVWGINAVGGVIMCDRIFHMDDVRVQEARAKAAPESNIAHMLEWLRVHPGPVITSRAHPDYPGLVEFPLEDVLNRTGRAPYFNSTAAYAVAYAIYLGVKRISLFGVDFTYPNAHQAEKGRACVEYWLGVAAQLGIIVNVPKTSTLLDAMNTQADRLYGYDTLDVTLRTEGERLCVDLVERETIPTADEIEARYDHSQHPNAIVEASGGR
ncbi:MAG: class I SAM-dependent methyltransferase [Phycisphaerales bacterium]|nr:class I SAM-dependent methyltransferase [Phycisphaerales bacterium]